MIAEAGQILCPKPSQQLVSLHVQLYIAIPTRQADKPRAECTFSLYKDAHCILEEDWVFVRKLYEKFIFVIKTP